MFKCEICICSNTNMPALPEWLRFHRKIKVIFLKFWQSAIAIWRRFHWMVWSAWAASLVKSHPTRPWCEETGGTKQFGFWRKIQNITNLSTWWVLDIKNVTKNPLHSPWERLNSCSYNWELFLFEVSVPWPVSYCDIKDLSNSGHHRNAESHTLSYRLNCVFWGCTYITARSKKLKFFGPIFFLFFFHCMKQFPNSLAVSQALGYI